MEQQDQSKADKDPQVGEKEEQDPGDIRFEIIHPSFLCPIICGQNILQQRIDDQKEKMHQLSLREPKPEQVKFQYGLIGQSGVGKTALCLHYMEGKNIKNESLYPTHGTDFFIKVRDISNLNVRSMVWDTAGMPQGHLVEMALKRLQGCLLVFDLTKMHSLQGCKQFLEMIAQFHDEQFPCMLVGNKADLEFERQVTSDDVREFIKESGRIIAYTEVSAYTGENVNRAFEKFQSALELQVPETEPIKLENPIITEPNNRERRRKCKC